MTISNSTRFIVKPSKLRKMDVITISDIDRDMTPIGCYYTEEGHPFYPEVKEETLCLPPLRRRPLAVP